MIKLPLGFIIVRRRDLERLAEAHSQVEQRAERVVDAFFPGGVWVGWAPAQRLDASLRELSDLARAVYFVRKAREGGKR